MQNLLVAQHSTTMVDHLQRALEDDGEIHIRLDSYPIIDMMQYLRPEAMVLDLNLSPKNGIAILEEGQPFLPSVIVATSNYVDDQVVEKMAQLGKGCLICTHSMRSMSKIN